MDEPDLSSVSCRLVQTADITDLKVCIRMLDGGISL